MNLSEAMVIIMQKEGITDAFGIPGAGINGFYEALDKAKDSIHHITMRHEECCVHAAAGYYRARRPHGGRLMHLGSRSHELCDRPVYG